MQGSCRRTLGDQGSNAARIAAEIRRKGLVSTQRKTVAVSGTAHGADGSCGLVSEITPIRKEKIQAETVSKTLHCNVRPSLPDKLGPHGQSKTKPRRIEDLEFQGRELQTVHLSQVCVCISCKERYPLHGGETGLPVAATVVFTW